MVVYDDFVLCQFCNHPKTHHPGGDEWPCDEVGCDCVGFDWGDGYNDAAERSLM